MANADRNGLCWGLSEDSDAAVLEFERLVSNEVTSLILNKTAIWWKNH